MIGFLQQSLCNMHIRHIIPFAFLHFVSSLHLLNSMKWLVDTTLNLGASKLAIMVCLTFACASLRLLKALLVTLHLNRFFLHDNDYCKHFGEKATVGVAASYIRSALGFTIYTSQPYGSVARGDGKDHHYFFFEYRMPAFIFPIYSHSLNQRTIFDDMVNILTRLQAII